MTADERLAPHSVALRSATAEDLPSLIQLTNAFYAEDGFATVQPQVLRERFVAFLGQPDANVTVAVTPTSTIGFALTTARLILESGLVAELQDLYVQPQHRHNGVGSAMVSDAACWARAKSATLLEVVIAPNGRDVSHLTRYYRSLGFEDAGRRIVHLNV